MGRKIWGRNKAESTRAVTAPMPRSLLCGWHRRCLSHVLMTRYMNGAVNNPDKVVSVDGESPALLERTCNPHNPPADRNHQWYHHTFLDDTAYAISPKPRTSTDLVDILLENSLMIGCGAIKSAPIARRRCADNPGHKPHQHACRKCSANYPPRGDRRTRAALLYSR
jgi:hypothetical protein